MGLPPNPTDVLYTQKCRSVTGLGHRRHPLSKIKNRKVPELRYNGCSIQWHFQSNMFIYERHYSFRDKWPGLISGQFHRACSQWCVQSLKISAIHSNYRLIWTSVMITMPSLQTIITEVTLVISHSHLCYAISCNYLTSSKPYFIVIRLS